LLLLRAKRERKSPFASFTAESIRIIFCGT
jgi:hypothetical protein